MEKVLLEEVDVFAEDENNIGDIPTFQMPVNVVDDVPVTAAYRRIPLSCIARSGTISTTW